MCRDEVHVQTELVVLVNKATETDSGHRRYVAFLFGFFSTIIGALIVIYLCGLQNKLMISPPPSSTGSMMSLDVL